MKPTRSQLKKEFFAGEINVSKFKKLLEDTTRFRGFYWKGTGKPKWSGPFRETMAQADKDNAPFFNQDFSVDIYIEQR